MQNKKSFLLAFILVGLVMKLVAEAVHELFGHGMFVLFFGGQITGLHISFLWPYDFSYINWSLPSTVSSAQMAWIHGGGILVGLCLSFLVQAFLILKGKLVWYLAVTLFWLAFWAFVNSTGYLIIGGLTPFGDVYALVELGVLTSLLSLSLGLVVFAIGFVSLSWILRRILVKVFLPEKASLGVSLFWLIIPGLVMTMLANPERDLQWAYLPSAFIPVLLSLIMERFFASSKQEADADPDDIAEN